MYFVGDQVLGIMHNFPQEIKLFRTPLYLLRKATIVIFFEDSSLFQSPFSSYLEEEKKAVSQLFQRLRSPEVL